MAFQREEPNIRSLFYACSTAQINLYANLLSTPSHPFWLVGIPHLSPISRAKYS